MNTVDDIINEMLAALTANIDYLSQAGNAQIRIRNGQLVQTIADKYVYEFSLEFLQNIEPDAEVEIRINNLSANGKVVALNEGSIQVEIDKNLGDKVTEALLIISSYYLLEMLKERLQKIQNGEIKITELASLLFDGSDTDAVELSSYTPPPAKELLNPYQLKALRLALGNPISFIWGPPGTGKTQTIASIIEGFMSEGKSVLLLSHTNKATDEALLKAVKHFGNDNEDYQQGKIIRYGEITVDELKDKYVTPAKIAEKNGRAIRSEIKKLEEDVAKLNKEIASSSSAIKSFERLHQLDSEIENLRSYVASKQNTASKYKENITNSKDEIENLKQGIANYKNKGTFGRLFSSAKPEQMEQSIGQLLRLIARRTEQVDEIKSSLREAKERFVDLTSNRKIAASELPNRDYDYYHDLVENGGVKILKLLEDQGFLERQLEELQENLVLEAKVVATTLTKSYVSKAVLSRQYDCVIIDEASMAPLPAVFCASGLAQENVVIVGDFLQLPPVTKHKIIRTKSKSEEDAIEEQRLVYAWLMRDIFSVAGVEQGVREKKNPHKMRQLKLQYRMHKTIADIDNEIAYGQFGSEYALETDMSATENRWPELFDKAPAKGSHVAFYDTSARAPVASQLDGGSYYNLYNALVCVEIAKQAVASGYTSIGIVSAYRAQVNLLQKMVTDTFKGSIKIDADTVHRFQGGEKQLVILDITTSNTKSMYDDGQSEGNDMKLLNVAISRAQDKCVIVGDMKQIYKSHSSTSLVKKIIEHVTVKHYPVYNTEELLDSFKVSEASDEWLKKMAASPSASAEMEKSKLFDEKDFYGKFIADMLAAKQEVIIDSPYITTRRVDELYKYFEEIRHRGVEIYVLTRVAREQDGKMQYYSEVEIERLTKLGIRVLPFIGKIHRKIAIIDRKILWEGSLNILSQNDSREVMRRFEGESSAKQMMTFLKLDKNLGDLGKPALQHCEFCEDPVAWYWTDSSIYGGLWTSCLLNRHKEGVPPKSNEQIKQIKINLREARKAVKEKTADGAPICPKHELVMIKRTGRYGEFWGCPRYPACKITERMR